MQLVHQLSSGWFSSNQLFSPYLKNQPQNSPFHTVLPSTIAPFQCLLWHGACLCTTFVFVFVLLSHLLCWPQRSLLHHSSWNPYLQLHPRLNILHWGSGPRGPQEMSDRWWAAIWRRHCTAAESLWWCSVVPVLIQQTQGITYYAPYWQQCLLSHRVRLGECPLQTADHHYVPPSFFL